MTHAFIIPWRYRGNDPLRPANFEYTKAYVEALDLGPVYVASDGRTGEAQFNRHAAYNSGAGRAFKDGHTTLTFYESDMIISRDQLVEAITAAETRVGLVVPFTERHEHNAQDSERIRNHEIKPWDCRAKVIKPKPRRTGAINVISRQTYEAVGQYDPVFSGSWFDDRAMHLAFDMCAGPTRWVEGPSHHLHHLPGYTGGHLTFEDRAATARNRRRFNRYERARTPEQIRRLTMGS